MGIDDHLDAFNGTELVEQLTNFLLCGISVQAKDSNAATGLRMIL